MTRYSRQDAVRILQLPLRDLKAWESAGLVASREQYSFDELGHLRTLRDLHLDEVMLQANQSDKNAESGIREDL